MSRGGRPAPFSQMWLGGFVHEHSRVVESLGRAIEFPPDWIPGMTGVVELTCTEHTVEIGLVKPPTTPPPGATDTQRLMAAAGRRIPA